MSFELPTDPIELARGHAEQLRGDGFDMTPNDELAIAELEYGALELDFLGQNYFVDAHTGFRIPVQFEASEPVTYYKYGQGITFSGELVTYSRVHIGRLIGAGAVRAICATFDKVTLLPFFDRLDEESLLHVPVLSVSSISQAS